MSTAAPGSGRSGPRRYIDEIAATARKLEADGTGLGDLKILAATLKEMRRAFKKMSAYRDKRKVVTFGSARARPDDAIYCTAEQFSREISRAGFMVITGAGPGIMEACQRGAGRRDSFGFNIRLSFEEANSVIRGDPKLLSFKYFFVRKLFFVKEAHAVVLFPGGFGTLDEGFEVLTLLQTGKCQPMPLALLDRPGGTYWKAWLHYVEEHMMRREMISREDLALFKATDRVDQAVREIADFYRVYHSARYVRDLLVIRLQRELSEPFVRELADRFADIIPRNTLAQCGAFPAERDDPAILHLPRLAFPFDRTRFGRLRMLIDRINQAPI